MNLYGLEAKEYWEKNVPSRYAELEDPETFFEQLGEQVEQQVLALSLQLQGSDPAEEDYLGKVRRLTSAQRQAEEVVKSDLVWVTPELQGAELREEWESSRPMDESILNNWAMPILNGDEAYKTIDEMVEYWMMPTSFFEELSTSETPWKVMDAHSTQLQAAADQRFNRWVKNGAPSGAE